jgi:hypothetical protein
VRGDPRLDAGENFAEIMKLVKEQFDRLSAVKAFRLQSLDGVLIIPLLLVLCSGFSIRE